MDEQRLIDLEMKIAHHEDTIESLQALVYEQQKAVAALDDKLTRFIKHIANLVDAGPEISPLHEKPPHY